VNVNARGRAGDPDRGRIRVALPNKGRLSDKAVALLEQAASRPRCAATVPSSPTWARTSRRSSCAPPTSRVRGRRRGRRGDHGRGPGRRERPRCDRGPGPGLRLLPPGRGGARRRPGPLAAELPAGTRVATSFPAVARRYFESLGIPIEIAPVTGATEIAPHLGVADVIVDLVSTGSTLRMNRAPGGGHHHDLHGPPGGQPPRPGRSRDGAGHRRPRHGPGVGAPRRGQALPHGQRAPCAPGRGPPGHSRHQRPHHRRDPGRERVGGRPRRGGRRPDLPDHRPPQGVGRRGILVTRIERLMP